MPPLDWLSSTWTAVPATQRSPARFLTDAPTANVDGRPLTVSLVSWHGAPAFQMPIWVV